ncbi:MAG: site-specific DNA-methyltransferase [Phycisphaerae bacterium]|nr:site-specific DNA-methyltransferase [Phycisphaerae bacterium]
MAEQKNTLFDRPGGYAMPSGAAGVHREAAASKVEMVLPGDSESAFEASSNLQQPLYEATDPDTRVYLGDCREVLANLPDRGKVDLVFADPPFNWDVPYDEWKDNMSRAQYERFTYDWLDACIDVLSPTGSLWVNIPDDTAAEVVMHLKRRGMTMINWCVWHFRFGQCRHSSFIMSKVHVLYFAKNPDERTWNPDEILEQSDRASVYKDARTMAKDTNKGMRVPMDVWYGSYLGRIQGNNKERRHGHHNQIPEAYLERVIRSTSNPGDLVLDPFLGSGTTSTVAKALERRSIGIEFSETNAKSAWERINSIGMIRKGTIGGSSAIQSKRGNRGKSKASS